MFALTVYMNAKTGVYFIFRHATIIFKLFPLNMVFAVQKKICKLKLNLDHTSLIQDPGQLSQ
jgi:hypothetical protein